jgi:methyl-accepting chemotaxis protein
LEDFYQLANAGDTQGVLAKIETARPIMDQVVSNLEQCLKMKVEAAQQTAIVNTATARLLLTVIIIVLAAAVISSLFLAFYISGIISPPIIGLTNFLMKANETGDLTLEAHDHEIIRKYSPQKDEIGQIVNAAAGFIGRIVEIGDALEKVADGDLTGELELLSQKDVIGSSLRKMNTNLNSMVGEINHASAQLSGGSKQIADSAQSLAQGATEQAAAVEEFSASISIVADKTKENAEKANKAAKRAIEVGKMAETGSEQMDQLTKAVHEINETSQNISKIIKTIDDIAFQTNILALNAAVEAARAGEYGKGFAVVAEEVRSLATKSADAAKDTDAMIQESVNKAELGARIADKTASSLEHIVSGINESNELVTEIAEASEEQSASIMQINTGIEQIAQVVQQNSATAEESNAASEELTSQAAILEGLTAQFKLKGGIYAEHILQRSDSLQTASIHEDGILQAEKY